MSNISAARIIRPDDQRPRLVFFGGKRWEVGAVMTDDGGLAPYYALADESLQYFEAPAGSGTDDLLLILARAGNSDGYHLLTRGIALLSPKKTIHQLATIGAIPDVRATEGDANMKVFSDYDPDMDVPSQEVIGKYDWRRTSETGGTFTFEYSGAPIDALMAS